MIRGPQGKPRLDSKAPLALQLEQQRCVMDDLPAPAELRVLVADRVQRVRIGGNDPLEAGRPEGGDIGLGQMLVKALLADPPHIVAGVALRVVQDAEVDAGRMQQPCKDLRHLLVARVERRVVANEPQQVHRLLARILDRER